MSKNERDWGLGLRPRGAQGCLDGGQLVDLAERGRRARRYAESMSHVAGCPSCRELLKQLRAVEARRASVRLSSRLRWARVTALAVGVSVAGVLGMLWLRGSLGPGATPSLDHPEEVVRAPAPATEMSPGPPPLHGGSLFAAAPKSAPKAPKASKPAKPIRKARGSVKPREPETPTSVEQGLDRSMVASSEAGGFGYGDLCGEVLRPNVESGEVISANRVQGEVKPRPARPPEQPF